MLKISALAMALLLSLTASMANTTDGGTKTLAEKPSLFDQGVDDLRDLQCDSAIRHFTSAYLRTRHSRLNKEKLGAYRSLLFVLIGRAFMFDENEPAAVQAFSIADALHPNDPTTIAYLADALYKKWAVRPVFSALSVADSIEEQERSRTGDAGTGSHQECGNIPGQSLLRFSRR